MTIACWLTDHNNWRNSKSTEAYNEAGLRIGRYYRCEICGESWIDPALYHEQSGLDVFHSKIKEPSK
jgi:hypothetical protein